jgi:hypothetical protein
LHSAVGKDVAEFRSTIAQHFADEQTTVALARPAAAAHKGEPVIGRAAQHSLDPRLKGRLGRHRAVKRMSLRVVVRLVVRASAQRVAHEDVLHTGRREEGLQLVTVEVRGDGRVGVRPDVDHEFDSL